MYNIRIRKGIKMMETFGDVVKSTRERLKLTVNDYILRLGNCVSRAYITKIELHDEIPSLELVEKIALVLALDEGHLVELAKEGKRNQFEKALNKKYSKASCLKMERI